VDVASIVAALFDGEPPFRVEAFDGSVVPASVSSPTHDTTLKVLRREALTRVLTRPGELGLARAYVAGDLDVDGDLDGLLGVKLPPPSRLLRPRVVRALLAELGPHGVRPLAPPSIEVRPRGVLHSRARDRQAVTHHYDVSSQFYEMVLGPSMTYSCAVFSSPDDTLEIAQRRKVDLIARKLALREGDRLLDIGCGWGTMAIHAARHYGARVVGITLSEPQARYATQRSRDEGVADLVEFRVQDYRDVDDAPFDAVSSIGMSEHVGRRSLDAYSQRIFGYLRPGGRFLNHAIGRPVPLAQDAPPSRAAVRARQVRVALGLRGPSKIYSPFIERYVFPDGELHDVGTVVTLFQTHGFEVRHLESLREHYSLTLRQWIANLMKRFDEAVSEVGEQRARAWRLYVTGSAVGFERHHLEIHQILSVRPDNGRSGVALRAHWEPDF